MLFDYAAAHHNITIDMDGPVDSLVINSVEPSSPLGGVCRHRTVP